MITFLLSRHCERCCRADTDCRSSLAAAMPALPQRTAAGASRRGQSGRTAPGDRPPDHRIRCHRTLHAGRDMQLRPSVREQISSRREQDGAVRPQRARVRQHLTQGQMLPYAARTAELIFDADDLAISPAIFMVESMILTKINQHLQ